MNGRDFLALARRLIAGATEAEWRTAVSRGYYAAFHVARDLREDLGFNVPKADQAHKYLSFRLSNCGDPHVEKAGKDLDVLRTARNQADYDLRRALQAIAGAGQVQTAGTIIQTLDALKDPRRSQVASGIRVYERDVLGEVTWRP